MIGLLPIHEVVVSTYGLPACQHVKRDEDYDDDATTPPKNTNTIVSSTITDWSTLNLTSFMIILNFIDSWLLDINMSPRISQI